MQQGDRNYQRYFTSAVCLVQFFEHKNGSDASEKCLSKKMNFSLSSIFLMFLNGIYLAFLAVSVYLEVTVLCTLSVFILD